MKPLSPGKLYRLNPVLPLPKVWRCYGDKGFMTWELQTQKDLERVFMFTGKTISFHSYPFAGPPLDNSKLNNFWEFLFGDNFIYFSLAETCDFSFLLIASNNDTTLSQS